MNKIIIELTEFNRLYFDNESEQYLHFADLYREKLLDLFYKNFVFRLDMFSPLPVLEIGQGTGILAEAILQSGLSYTAVDISHRMIKTAKAYLLHRVPDRLESAEFIHADVTSQSWSQGRRFQALLIQAVIHLFPKDIAKTILVRLLDKIQKRGYVWIATTESTVSTEGFFVDANLKRPSRALNGISSFRAFYTKEEFFKLAHSVGLEIIRFIDNEDKERDHTRHWMILVCRKKI